MKLGSKLGVRFRSTDAEPFVDFWIIDPGTGLISMKLGKHLRLESCDPIKSPADSALGSWEKGQLLRI